jgi:uncharacterized iron-regulated protein
MKTCLLFLFFILFSPKYSFAYSSILIIGESHVDDVSRHQLEKELKDYAQKGFRYLGLEMVKDNRQNILDQFNFSLTGSESAVFELLEKEWGYNSYSYLDLMKEANRQGIKLIALDLPKENLPRETGPFPVLPEFSAQMDSRNQRMAKNISSFIEANPGAKILVLVGSFHARDYGIPKYLSRMGYLFEVK